MTAPIRDSPLGDFTTPIVSGLTEAPAGAGRLSVERAVELDAGLRDLSTSRARAEVAARGYVVAGDHPHTDPGDGRTECDRCGKYIWPATHSCKGVPVTAAAMRRWRIRQGLEPCCDMHNQHCEPPSELCCYHCTEAAHDTFPTPHADGSRCVLDTAKEA